MSAPTMGDRSAAISATSFSGRIQDRQDIEQIADLLARIVASAAADYEIGHARPRERLFVLLDVRQLAQQDGDVAVPHRLAAPRIELAG